MKNLIFILSGLILFTFASCKKEEIRPNITNSEIENNSIEYIIDTDITLKEDKTGYNFINTDSNNGVKKRVDSDSDTTPTITDPNRDDEEERRGRTLKSSDK